MIPSTGFFTLPTFMNTNHQSPEQDNVTQSSSFSSDIVTPETIVEAGPTQDFYVVSLKKFWLLFVLTMGFYGVFWFYKNWAMYKQSSDDKDIWPVPRAIFYIFFTHYLCNAVDAKIQDQQKNFSWSPSMVATTFVILSLLNRLVERFASKNTDWGLFDAVSMSLLFVLGYLLSQVQIAINVACNDPKGQSNSRLSEANWFWMLIGAILWLLTVIGIMYTPAPT